MVHSRHLAVGILAALPHVKAGFDPSSDKNVAVYWGKSLSAKWLRHNSI